MKYSVRDLSLISILASVNGVLEISLGTFLHCVDIPVAGSVMIIFNMTLYFIGRKFVPRVGIVLFMGMVTAIMKLLYSGGIKLSPAIAILLEAFILEIILDVFPFRKITASLSGAILHSFSLIYFLIAYAIIGGSFALDNLGRLIVAGCDFLPLKGGIILVFIIYFFAGYLLGIVAWHISSQCISHYESYLGEKRAIMQKVEPTL